MPRSKQANEEIRKEASQKILDAAIVVFAAKGRAATMADITTKAGVSEGLIYHYFTSKEEIFTILMKEAAASGGGPIARIEQIKGTPGTRLAILISTFLQNRRDKPGYYQIINQVLDDDTAPSDLKEVLQKNGLTVAGIIRQLIVEGQKTGEIAKDNPDQLMTVVLACFDGLLKKASHLDPEEAKKMFPDPKIILRILRPDPE